MTRFVRYLHSKAIERAKRRDAQRRLAEIVQATRNSAAIRQYRACREASLIVRGRA